jgi:uncharacterized membrane protein
MNPTKPTLKTELIPLLLLIITILLSFCFYANFPEQVPMHWNAAGEIDDYGSKAVGAFALPGLLLFIYGLFFALPFLDPKKERYIQFRKTYHVFKGIIMFYLAFIYGLIGLAGLGYNVNIGLWMPVMIGTMFIVLGNYMPKIKANWFMGIRTPWTLSSEEVWNKTHRLGGKLFLFGGIVLMLEPLLPVSWRIPVLIVDVLVIVIIPLIYSYILFSKEQRQLIPSTREKIKS